MFSAGDPNTLNKYKYTYIRRREVSVPQPKLRPQPNHNRRQVCECPCGAAGQAPTLTVALSRTLMEHGSATLCFRRACSNSCRGGRSHFPKTTKSMSLDRRTREREAQAPISLQEHTHLGRSSAMECTHPPPSWATPPTPVRHIPLREGRHTL